MFVIATKKGIAQLQAVNENSNEIIEMHQQTNTDKRAHAHRDAGVKNVNVSCNSK